MVVAGFQGIDENGDDAVRGGNILSTGDISITLTDTAAASGLTISQQSTIRADETGQGTFSSAVTIANIDITSADGVAVLGLLEAAGGESEINIQSAGLVLVDGVIKAGKRIIINAGTHESGAGLVIQPLILEEDEFGNLIDVDGNLTDNQGFIVNANGDHLNAAGQVTITISYMKA